MGKSKRTPLSNLQKRLHAQRDQAPPIATWLFANNSNSGSPQQDRRQAARNSESMLPSAHKSSSMLRQTRNVTIVSNRRRRAARRNLQLRRQPKSRLRTMNFGAAICLQKLW